MKRQVKRGLVSLTLVCTMLVTLCMGMMTAGAADMKITEAPDVSIMIAGELKSYEQIPIIVNGSTFLPLRALASSLGIPNDDQHIIWNQSEKSVTLKSADNSRTVYLSIGSLEGKINGTSQKLNAAPVLYKNSTYIPVRFVADALDMTVLWDAPERRVYIRDAVEYEKVYSALMGMQYPLQGASVNYTKQFLDKKYAQKTGTVLENYESNGKYSLNVTDASIKVTAEIKTTYNNQSIVENYKTDSQGILYSNSRGDKGYLTDEGEANLFSGIFSDIGLRLETPDEEKTEEELAAEKAEEQAEEERIAAGGISFLEKLCMYTAWQEDSHSVSVALPYHQVQEIEDCELYTRTLVMDPETFILQKEVIEIKLVTVENGVTVITERKITVEFE